MHIASVNVSRVTEVHTPCPPEKTDSHAKVCSNHGRFGYWHLWGNAHSIHPSTQAHRKNKGTVGWEGCSIENTMETG